MPTSVALTDHLESFIQSQIANGRYNNASEVVRDGLRLLERQQQVEAAKLDAMRKAAQAGFADIAAGRSVELNPEDIDTWVANLGKPAKTKRAAPARGQR
ncbi:MAG: type II toxin-antitoxin system ParD family antitoxin [Nevskia sp.]|nr:type II toxin-antitoxin system ParD family antitoxin [Nevskia sp.]